jgi:hypothetical protein
MSAPAGINRNHQELPGMLIFSISLGNLVLLTLVSTSTNGNKVVETRTPLINGKTEATPQTKNNVIAIALT